MPTQPNDVNKPLGSVPIDFKKPSKGNGETALTPEERDIVNDIHKSSHETTKVLRALSVSLIGRVNGDVVDAEGGRVGRLEKDVQMLMSFKEDIGKILAKWTGIMIASLAVIQYLVPWIIRQTK